MKINQNSCTTDHGYLTDYEIRLWMNMADEISDIFDFDTDDSEEEHREAKAIVNNTMPMFSKCFIALTR